MDRPHRRRRHRPHRLRQDRDRSPLQLDQLRRSADDGLPITSGTLTIADLLELWETKALPNRDLSASRLVSHRWAVNVLIDELGTVKFRSLTIDDVEAALTRRTHTIDTAPRRKGRCRTSGSALSRNSLIKLRSTLSQALTWAQRRNLVARNVAELLTTDTPEQPGKSLTAAQARQLLHRRRRHRPRSHVDPHALPRTPPR